MQSVFCCGDSLILIHACTPLPPSPPPPTLSPLPNHGSFYTAEDQCIIFNNINVLLQGDILIKGSVAAEPCISFLGTPPPTTLCDSRVWTCTGSDTVTRPNSSECSLKRSPDSPELRRRLAPRNAPPYA